MAGSILTLFFLPLHLKGRLCRFLNYVGRLIAPTNMQINSFLIKFIDINQVFKKYYIFYTDFKNNIEKNTLFKFV